MSPRLAWPDGRVDARSYPLTGLLVALAVVSAGLEWAAYPPGGRGYLAWVCLIPLFVAMERAGPRGKVLLPVVWALTLQAFLFAWLRTPPPCSILGGNVIFAGFLASKLPLPALTGWVLSRVRATTVWPRALHYACAWCALEYLDTWGPWGDLWGSLAPTQIEGGGLVHAAALAGPWAITFPIALASAVVACGLGRRTCPTLGRSAALAMASGAAVLSYAHLQASRALAPGPGPVTVAVVQPNVSFERKLRQASRWDEYVSLVQATRQAVTGPVDLVIWPETSVPWHEPWANPLARNCMLNIQQQVHSPMLVGTDDAAPDGATYNACWLIDQGSIFQSYIKNRLLYMAEYIPAWAWLRNHWDSPYGGFYPGTRRHVFTVGPMRISPLICVESCEPLVNRQDLLAGANLEVVLCNDGFTFNPQFAMQHFDLARLLAIETHRPVVQVANTGISGVITAQGQVQQHTEWYQETGFSASVELGNARDITPYVRFGDYLAWLSLGYLLLGFRPAREPGTDSA